MANAYTAPKAQICVDEYNGGILSGRVYFDGHTGHKNFDGMEALIRELGSYLKANEYPISSTNERWFDSAVPDNGEFFVAESDEDRMDGKLATFSVQIQYRQNATWQGKLFWIENGTGGVFKSELELMKMMDSALTSI